MYNTNLNPQIACHTNHSNSDYPIALPPLTLSKSFEPLNIGSESASGVACSPHASIFAKPWFMLQVLPDTKKKNPNKCHVAVNLPGCCLQHHISIFAETNSLSTFGIKVPQL